MTNSMTGAQPAKWVPMAKDFLNLDFASGRRVVKCQCKKCQNYKLVSHHDMSGHIAKQGFIPNYLVWRDHREVQPTATTESNENEDEDLIKDMIADICREYDLGSRE
jgi:hypothetical protein